MSSVAGVAATLMDGNALRDEIVAGLRAKIEAAGSPAICLATVLVGDDGPSQRYVRSKHQKAGEAGLASRHVDLPATATQAEVEAAVLELVRDDGVHGILVQLPLPDGLDPEPVLDLIPPGEGCRRSDRAIDGPPRPRSSWPRRLHAARRDAAPRALRRPHERQAGGRHRPVDARRSATEPAARPQGRRRHRHARPLAHPGHGRGRCARPTSWSARPARPA